MIPLTIPMDFSPEEFYEVLDWDDFGRDAEDWHQKRKAEIRRDIICWREWLGPWAVERRLEYLRKNGKTEKAGALETRAIEDWEIQRARDVRLEDYLGVKTGHRMPCPFHNGNGKNMMVKGFAYCFVCGEGADSIRYVMRVESKTFFQAVKILAES